MDYVIESDGKKIQVIILDSVVSSLKPMNGATDQRATVCVIATLRTGLPEFERVSEATFCHPTDTENLRSGRIKALRRTLKEAVSWGMITHDESTLAWDKFYECIGEVNPRLKGQPSLKFIV